VSSSPDVVAVTQPRIVPSGTLALIQAYPNSAPQAVATTNLHLGDERTLKEFGFGLAVAVFLDALGCAACCCPEPTPAKV
jgi:hypothetical protein